MEIILPEPSLIILVGIAGAGKSRFAHRHFQPTEIVSSDHCRALICDDENDQRVNQEAFELLHLLTARRLSYQRLTVIDATNIQTSARQILMALARAHQVSTVAIIFELDPDLCLQQNSQRLLRVVPSEIIQLQQGELQAALAELPEEGWDFIYRFTNTAEIDAAVIGREKIIS